ncbi:hypothetical protein Hanom_Chr01g00004021 [Helianthus anomalus]
MKWRKKERKKVAKVLKHEVVQTQVVKPNVKKGKQKQIWKPKPIIVSGGAQSFPNHPVIKVTILDDARRPKSMKVWVPLSN